MLRLKTVRNSIPWIVTAIALYVAFRSVEWEVLFAHIAEVNVPWIIVALLFTMLSYLLRARRWQHLYPSNPIEYFNGVAVLILGFFMNNVLPARTGELVRAHMGAKVTSHTRTLVLATIASERLADGITLSLFFLCFAAGLGDSTTSNSLLWVAGLFFSVAIGVGLTLRLKDQIFGLITRLNKRFKGSLSSYTFDRVQIFIDGLQPLVTPAKLPLIVTWSLVIWFIELMVYVAICNSFDVVASWQLVVLFLVTVNFSSLIPAAPGGIGVIEAITSAVLISMGIDRERALAMVIVQHAIQYLVVGVPGALVLLNWKSKFSTKECLE